MKICEVVLESNGPYSQSRNYTQEVAKLNKESPTDYEDRTWRNRMHVTPDGEVFIPPMAFKNAISEAAKYLSKQIPGKGKSTYTKHFEAGVLVAEPSKLGVFAKDVIGQQLFVPADGKRGGAKRVWRTFPVIPEWKARVSFHILDETITPEVFETHLKEAGNFIGIGRFRPRNNGYYGRFKILSAKWHDGS